jgi:hypothetical protein
MSDDRPRTIDRTDRAYRAWLDSEADIRRGRHEQRARRHNAERDTQRAAMSTLQLHHHALELAVTLSTVPAGGIEKSRGGGDPQILAGSQQLLDDDPRWREHWAVIRSRLLRALALLDEHRGHGPVPNPDMTGPEKDRLILTEGEGYSAEAVVALLGAHVAGSARTVRRVRKLAGRDPKDGRHPDTPTPPPTPASTAVRRVRIEER